MAWLQEDQIPKSTSRYTKLDEGETRLRIVSEPIAGIEAWQYKKPIRRRRSEPFTKEEVLSFDTPKYGDKVKEWIACVVYNYNTKQVELWQIKQKSIISQLQSLTTDSDFPELFDLKEYDIKIIREDGDKVEYTVKNFQPKELSEEIRNEVESTKVRLDALYDNGNPFEG